MEKDNKLYGCKGCIGCEKEICTNACIAYHLINDESYDMNEETEDKIIAENR